MFNLIFASFDRLSGEFLLLGVIAFCIWLGVLIRVLTRPEIDPVTRFMWVFLLVSLNILGIILYAFCGPPASQAIRQQPVSNPQQNPPSPLDY